MCLLFLCVLYDLSLECRLDALKTIPIKKKISIVIIYIHSSQSDIPCNILFRPAKTQISLRNLRVAKDPTDSKD